MKAYIYEEEHALDVSVEAIVMYMRESAKANDFNKRTLDDLIKHFFNCREAYIEVIKKRDEYLGDD